MTRQTSSTTDPSPPRGGRDGFALMELMLALALIALVAALALPRARPFDGGAALRSKAYETAALLRADRDAARRLNREVASTVDFGLRRIVSGGTHDAVGLPEGVSMRLSAPDYAGFRFFPDGRSSGGALSLTAGTRALTLKVDGLTSAVEIKAAGAPDQ